MGKAISTAWQKNKDFKKPFTYVLEDITDEETGKVTERGQEVTLHRLDMPDIMKLGIANEVDFMTKAVMENPQTTEANNREIIANAMKMADNFGKMEIMVNKICIVGVIDPKLYEIPRDENARQAGLMYIDEVPWDDRMELFGVIFDSEGLTDFREEQEPGVGDVADVQDVQLPADDNLADVRPRDTEGVLSQ